MDYFVKVTFRVEASDKEAAKTETEEALALYGFDILRERTDVRFTRRGPQGPRAGTDARSAEMIELRQAGLTYDEIGEFFGVSRQRVYQIIGLAGIGRQHGGVTQAQVQRVFRGLGSLAKAMHNNRHGTISRYRGQHRAFPACSCELCRTANREHLYKSRPPKGDPRYGTRRGGRPLADERRSLSETNRQRRKES
jgi:hypothetical protein